MQHNGKPVTYNEGIALIRERHNEAKAVATATYRDTWAGMVPATLQPQKTTRGGQRVTVYRWIDDRGMCCDGLRCGHGLDRMISHAEHHPAFSHVARS